MAKDDEARIRKDIERVAKQIGDLHKPLADLEKELKDRKAGPKVPAPMEKKRKPATDAFDAMKKSSGKRNASPAAPIMSATAASTAPIPPSPRPRQSRR